MTDGRDCLIHQKRDDKAVRAKRGPREGRGSPGIWGHGNATGRISTANPREKDLRAEMRKEKRWQWRPSEAGRGAVEEVVARGRARGRRDGRGEGGRQRRSPLS